MTNALLAIGIAGNVTGFLLYASPIPIFWRIVKRKSTEAFSGVPYAFALLSTMQWAYFGVLRGPHARPVVSLMAIGFALQLAFNLIYLRFGSKSQRVVQGVLLGIVASFYVAMVTLTTKLMRGQMRANVVGIVCAINSICFGASPLLIMKRVMQSSSVEFMPFYLPLFLLLSGGLWLIFGVLTQDVILMVPNALNVSLGVLQILVYVYYKIRGGGWKISSSKLNSRREVESIGKDDGNLNNINTFPKATPETPKSTSINAFSKDTPETPKPTQLSQITCTS